MTINTLVLNFSGPLQSWAGPAVVKTRVDTEREPSPRAIRGLLAACFGVERGAPLPPLLEEAKIRVHTVRPGRVVRDFQTAHPQETEYGERLGRVLKKGSQPPRALWPGSTIKGVKYPGVLHRTYLGDACFLVAVTVGDESALEELLEGVTSPVWSPYLGKRAFPPTFPFLLGSFPEEEAFEKALARLRLVEQEEEVLPHGCVDRGEVA